MTHAPTMHTLSFSLAPREPVDGLCLREVVNTCTAAVAAMSSETKNNLRLGMEIVAFALLLFSAAKAFVLLPQRMDQIEQRMQEIQLRNNIDHDLLIKLGTVSEMSARDIGEIKETLRAMQREWKRD